MIALHLQEIFSSPFKSHCPPPAGYASWLDYAVEAFSTRQAWLESLWETWADDTAVELDREEIRESARLELRALRKAAGVADP